LLAVRATDGWWLTDSSDCPARAWSCHFKALSSCDGEYDDWPADAAPRLGTPAAEAAAVVTAGYDELRRMLDRPAVRSWLPWSYRRNGRTLLWWRATLVGLLFKPRATLLARASAAAPGWVDAAGRPPLLGVHVRHGDKAVEATQLGWRVYQQAAEVAATRLAADWRRVAPNLEEATVFVTSDSAALPAIAANATASGWGVDLPGGTRLRLRLEVAPAGVALAGAPNDVQTMQTHALNVTAYTEEAVRVVWLLSECDFLLATFSSNTGRLAYELAIAKRMAHAVAGEPGDVWQGGALSLDLLWHAMP
jgi:hypothetical protein